MNVLLIPFQEQRSATGTKKRFLRGHYSEEQLRELKENEILVLCGAELQQADLRDAKLQNAILKDADLQGTYRYDVRFDSETALADS